jgi:hypothetical protein
MPGPLSAPGKDVVSTSFQQFSIYKTTSTLRTTALYINTHILAHVLSLAPLTQSISNKMLKAA